MPHGDVTIARSDTGNGISWPEFLMGLAPRATTANVKGDGYVQG